MTLSETSQGRRHATAWHESRSSVNLSLANFSASVLIYIAFVQFIYILYCIFLLQLLMFNLYLKEGFQLC